MPVSFFFFFCLSSPADPEQTRTTLPDAGWDCTSIIFRSDLLSPWIPALSTLNFLPSSASQHSPEVFFIFFTFKIRKGDLYYQTNHMGEDGLSIYIGSLFP